MTMSSPGAKMFSVLKVNIACGTLCTFKESKNAERSVVEGHW